MVSDTLRSPAIFGRMPTITNSLMPSAKLNATNAMTGMVKKRSDAAALRDVIRLFPLLFCNDYAWLCRT